MLELHLLSASNPSLDVLTHVFQSFLKAIRLKGKNAMLLMQQVSDANSMTLHIYSIHICYTVVLQQGPTHSQVSAHLSLNYLASVGGIESWEGHRQFKEPFKRVIPIFLRTQTQSPRLEENKNKICSLCSSLSTSASVGHIPIYLFSIW